jgi:hypothetical protein
MVKKYRFCKAFHWDCKKLASSIQNNILFGDCCLSGKYHFPPLQEPPVELRQLYYGQSPREKGFCKNIRAYNNALAMTSAGAKLDNSVNQGGGPYCYRLHGQLTHRLGSLLPEAPASPRYAQLYIVESQNLAVNIRMGNSHNSHTDRLIMTLLVDIMYRHNPHVGRIQQAYELLQTAENASVRMRVDHTMDQRRYN